MQSVSIADVRRIAARVGELSRQVGLWNDTEIVAIGMDEGSKLYGRAYRLYAMHGGSSAHYQLPRWLGSDFLGMTKREAWDTLADRQSTLYLLADERNIDIDHELAENVAGQAVAAGRVDWSLWCDVPPWRF